MPPSNCSQLDSASHISTIRLAAPSVAKIATLVESSLRLYCPVDFDLLLATAYPPDKPAQIYFSRDPFASQLTGQAVLALVFINDAF